MKINNVGSFKVGDVVRFKTDTCGCCIDPRSRETIGTPDTWFRSFEGIILSTDKKSNLVHVGFEISGNLPASRHLTTPEERGKFTDYEFGLHVNQDTVCELVTAAKSSSTSSHSLGFLFACIGVGAGVSHYTCMQRNNSKEAEKSLTR